MILNEQIEIQNLSESKSNDIEEFNSMYTMADIFINASVEEAMGLATIESLAWGTLAIVNDSATFLEVETSVALI